jgi:Ferredoxin
MSDGSVSLSDPVSERSGLEPELGGFLRSAPERSGFEPELGGVLRQKGVYVDELTCIGCKHCSHVARILFLFKKIMVERGYLDRMAIHPR